MNVKQQIHQIMAVDLGQIQGPGGGLAKRKRAPWLN
jgi:hypothetical protein